MFWQLRIGRKFRLRAALVLISALLLMASCTCTSYGTFRDLLVMDNSGGNCDCDGSTLVCTRNGASNSVANSYYCRQADLNSQGYCQCDGTTLSCTFYMCLYDNVGNFLSSELYAPCDANGQGVISNEPLIRRSSSSTTLGFENSELCKGNPPSTEEVTEAAIEAPTETPTLTLTPTDTPTLTATSTSTATKTHTPKPDVTEPPAPAQCEAGWLPAAGCTCCASTLVCSDGTVAPFNPQCTGGPACVCGDGVCSQECGEFTTCLADCS